MKEILVISGKGGSGKTTVSAALMDLFSKEHRIVMVDADVDAANLELLLNPKLVERSPFMAGKVVKINQTDCIACGICAQVCRFEAVKVLDGIYHIDESFCEGCLSCFHQCPANAIKPVETQNGEWFQSETRFGRLFHAQLKPGGENSGKLVDTIKSAAIRFAISERADFILIDGPPGIGCPVTASLRGSDLAVIVCEPTISGVHDMERVFQAAQHFNIPCGIVINKCDLNQQMNDKIVHFSKNTETPVFGQIPYDERIIQSIHEGVPATRLLHAETIHNQFDKIAKNISFAVGGEK